MKRNFIKSLVLLLVLLQLQLVNADITFAGEKDLPDVLNCTYKNTQ